MRFRCPYCGELSFSAGHKLGFFGKGARHIPSRHYDYCPDCNGNPPKSSNKISKMYIVCYAVDIVYIVLLFFALFRSVLTIVAGLASVLLIPFFIASSYYLRHYDLYESDKRKRDKILIKFSDSLPFRKNTNEYVCELQIFGNSQREKTYILFDDAYKSTNKTLKFCMVAGRTPYVNDKVRVITSKDVYIGEITEIIPKDPTDTDVIPEFPDTPKKPKRLKNWQNPDYFN